MAISQNFKTQVVFGGRIDPSFRRGTTELNDAIRQTSSTVGKLTKSQDKLKDKIAAMKLAGKDVSDLSAQYQKLDRRIKATTQDQEALNTQLAKKQRLEKWTGRAKGAAKWGGRAAAGAVRATGRGIKWGTLGAVGLLGGAAAGALAMNAETSENIHQTQEWRRIMLQKQKPPKPWIICDTLNVLLVQNHRLNHCSRLLTRLLD